MTWSIWAAPGPAVSRCRGHRLEHVKAYLFRLTAFSSTARPEGGSGKGGAGPSGSKQLRLQEETGVCRAWHGLGCRRKARKGKTVWRERGANSCVCPLNFSRNREFQGEGLQAPKLVCVLDFTPFHTSCYYSVTHVRGKKRDKSKVGGGVAGSLTSPQNQLAA